jgi:LPS export ABC transporter protein LptC
MYLSKRQSRLVALGTLAAFFVGGSVYIGFSRPGSAPSITPDTVTDSGGPATPSALGSPSGSNFVLNNFHRSEMKDGKKIWEVTATRGQYFPETNTAQLDEPSLLFYRSTGEVVELRAAQALLTLSGTTLNRAEISGAVRVVYGAKTTMTTEFALYDRASDTVTAPGEVTISSAELDIVGRELTAQIESQVFTLAKDVSSTVKRSALRREKDA